jgi:hypothetical protein
MDPIDAEECPDECPGCFEPVDILPPDISPGEFCVIIISRNPKMDWYLDQYLWDKNLAHEGGSYLRRLLYDGPGVPRDLRANISKLLRIKWPEPREHEPRSELIREAIVNRSFWTFLSKCPTDAPSSAQLRVCADRWLDQRGELRSFIGTREKAMFLCIGPEAQEFIGRWMDTSERSMNAHLEMIPLPASLGEAMMVEKEAAEALGAVLRMMDLLERWFRDEKEGTGK